MKWIFVGALGGLIGILYAALQLKKHFPFREAAPPLKQLLNLKSDPRNRMWS